MPGTTRLRAILALILLVSAVGFGFASRAERQAEARGSASQAGAEGTASREAAEQGSGSTTSIAHAAGPASTSPASPTTLREGTPAREAAERARRSTTSAPVATASPPVPTTAVGPTTTVLVSSPSSTDETLFGVRTESAATAAAVVALLLLAALASLAVRDRWALVGVAAVVLALALLDVREAVHQGHEGRSGLMVAALALAVLHLIGAGLGVIASRTAAELAPPPR